MILDTHLRSLQVVLGEAHATRAMDLTACYAQADASGAFVTLLSHAGSNGVAPVTIVGTPTLGKQYLINEVRAHNSDTVTHTVVLRLQDGSTTRIIYTGAVQPGADWVYTPEAGVGGGAGGGGGGGSAVTSWNARIGDVTLGSGDITAAGGALLVSPAMTGSPTAPTVSPPSDSSTKLATTAFVQGAIAAVSSGVTNIVAGSGLVGGGTGAVTLAVGTNAISNALSAQMAANTIKGNATGATANATDLTAAAAMTMLGAAPINNPTFTGSVTVPGGSINNATIGQTTPAAITGTAITATTGLIAPSYNGGQLAGFRNVIINGSFDRWQRGSSFANPASGQYLADRWMYSSDGTGATISVGVGSATANAMLADAGFTNYLSYYCSVAGSGATSRWIGQRIESVRTLAGRTVTVSFWAWADASRGCSCSWQQYFGTGGSPSGVVNGAGQPFTVTTAIQRFSLTFAITSIAGKTIGTNSDSFLLFYFVVPINTTATINFTGFQIEPGTVATPFEWRPAQTELALCQRYYQTGVGQINGYGNAASASLATAIPLQVNMRAAPTLTPNYTTQTNCTGSMGNYGTGSVNLGASTTAAGMMALVCSFTANAEL